MMDSTLVEAAPVLRVARPSRNIDATAGFYTRGFGLEVLERFRERAGGWRGR